MLDGWMDGWMGERQGLNELIAALGICHILSFSLSDNPSFRGDPRTQKASVP